MGHFYRRVLRPALFAIPSEPIHNATLAGLGLAAEHADLCALMRRFFGAPELSTEVFGLRFPNPLGLAAGMDKRASAVPAWEALGFGFSELGGVTRHPQPGNPAPRMFRAPAEGALVNRMGFNNPGAEAFAERLRTWHAAGRWPAHPVGVNLGKSKVTPLAEAADDYGYSFRRCWPWADFFVVNVSSPNTPNLRQLQDADALDAILRALQQDTGELATAAGRGPKPLLVKVAPDLSLDALDEILSLAVPRGLAGIIAANTTLTRPGTGDARAQAVFAEAGGLSGRPLRRRANEVIRHLHRQTRGRLPVIGVGGVFDAADAWEKLACGASLVQAYTGMVYEGPALARVIVCGLRERLARSGAKAIGEIVGSAA
ncbi:MAG: quinone-dependent dihydroorotate dehydrogenase [Limisphaerales bacterium]